MKLRMYSKRLAAKHVNIHKLIKNSIREEWNKLVVAMSRSTGQQTKTMTTLCN